MYRTSASSPVFCQGNRATLGSAMLVQFEPLSEFACREEYLARLSVGTARTRTLLTAATTSSSGIKRFAMMLSVAVTVEEGTLTPAGGKNDLIMMIGRRQLYPASKAQHNVLHDVSYRVTYVAYRMYISPLDRSKKAAYPMKKQGCAVI